MALHVCALHEGGNFRFGHRAEAGVKELAGFWRRVWIRGSSASRGARAWAGGFKFGGTQSWSRPET